MEEEAVVGGVGGVTNPELGAESCSAKDLFTSSSRYFLRFLLEMLLYEVRRAAVAKDAATAVPMSWTLWEWRSSEFIVGTASLLKFPAKALTSLSSADASPTTSF
jgi:hypothetical protein